MKRKNKIYKFEINTGIYPVEVILGTAYSFLDKAYIFLDYSKNKSISVVLESKGNEDGRKIAGELKNELINQSLRNSISKQNQSIREYIVGSAILGATTKRIQKNREKIKEKKDDNLGLTLEKDKDLLKELKKLEKEFGENEEGFDFSADEMGIAVPWEEKNLKNEK